MGAEPKSVARLLKGALRLLYPPQCLGCGAAVADDGGLCGGCWRETDFLHGLTTCDRCGVPLPDPGDGTPRAGLACDDCRVIARPWRHGRAALTYAGTARSLVLALKHGDRPDMVPRLGGWLADAAEPLVAPGMLVVPVPVHPLRLLKRRYNQAALLAQRLAALHGLEVAPTALRRVRNTPMQDHRGIADRFANQQGAVAVTRSWHARLHGRQVLLVDDVMASGATAASAAEALLAAGAASVDVAVLARAVKDA